MERDEPDEDSSKDEFCDDDSNTTTSSCSDDKRADKSMAGGKVLTDLYPGSMIYYGNDLFVAGSANYMEHTRIVSINNGTVQLETYFKLLPDTIVFSKKFKYGQRFK
jgi:hypothetical protein